MWLVCHHTAELWWSRDVNSALLVSSVLVAKVSSEKMLACRWVEGTSKVNPMTGKRLMVCWSFKWSTVSWVLLVRQLHLSPWKDHSFWNSVPWAWKAEGNQEQPTHLLRADHAWPTWDPSRMKWLAIRTLISLRWQLPQHSYLLADKARAGQTGC